MDVNVHCPSCDAQIFVPQEAAGRRARCPKCRHVFTVPSPKDLMEDTFSAWIEEDVEHFIEDRHHHNEELLESSVTLPTIQEEPAPPPSETVEIEPAEDDRPRRRLWPTRRKSSKKSKRHGQAWDKLPSALRKRLAQWCQVRVDELFDLYLPDADLSREDTGNAGIILTDQRLIYCRYHHRGQVERNDPTYTILCKPAGPEVHLVLAHGGERDQMVHLLERHAKRLEEKLKGDALRIEHLD